MNNEGEGAPKPKDVMVGGLYGVQRTQKEINAENRARTTTRRQFIGGAAIAAAGAVGIPLVEQGSPTLTQPATETPVPQSAKVEAQGYQFKPELPQIDKIDFSEIMVHGANYIAEVPGNPNTFERSQPVLGLTTLIPNELNPEPYKDHVFFHMGELKLNQSLDETVKSIPLSDIEKINRSLSYYTVECAGPGYDDKGEGGHDMLQISQGEVTTIGRFRRIVELEYDESTDKYKPVFSDFAGNKVPFDSSIVISCLNSMPYNVNNHPSDVSSV